MPVLNFRNSMARSRHRPVPALESLLYKEEDGAEKQNAPASPSQRGGGALSVAGRHFAPLPKLDTSRGLRISYPSSLDDAPFLHYFDVMLATFRCKRRIR